MGKLLVLAFAILLGACSVQLESVQPEGMDVATDAPSSQTTTRPANPTAPPPGATPTPVPTATPLVLPSSTAVPTSTPVPTPTPRREDEAEAIWRPRADALISYFENSTTELQYGYAEALGDGRGITAGRAGFTSGTGDLVLVVERVVAANPDNELAEYLPELRRLADAWSPDVSGLVGFERVWAAQAQDPTMRDAQDAVVDELYFFPSQAVADELGLELPLSRAAIFGTAIQHGIGDDPDGLPALAFEASTEVGGSPSSGVDELVWLRAFLATRKAHLLNAYDPATREVWAQSAGRVDTWVDLLDRGLVDLDQSFTATAFGSQFDID